MTFQNKRPEKWEFCNRDKAKTRHTCLCYVGPREGEIIDRVENLDSKWLTRHEVWECNGCTESFYRQTSWYSLNSQDIDIHYFGDFEEYDGDVIQKRFPPALKVKLSPYTDKEISTLIKKSEDSFLEFKETLSYDVRQEQENKNLHQNVIKTVCAFLNSQGGVLIIGIKDNGNIVGIEKDILLSKNKNIDSFQLKLQDILRSKVKPLQFDNIDIKFETINEKILCGVYINPSDETVYCDDEVFIRMQNQTVRLEGQNLERWLVEKRT